jgi:hypothetical protein
MRYYAIIDVSTFNASLPESIIEYMGYDPSLNYKLKDVHFCNSYLLDDGNIVIPVQLCKPQLVSSRCVYHNITYDELTIAKYYYGESIIISDISKLDIIGPI